MNTEIIDYLKELAKKEFFAINFINTALSIVIIICAIISLRTGATDVLYTIMFSMATVLLGTNSYKCFKRGYKSGWAFAVIGVIFLGISALCIVSLVMN